MKKKERGIITDIILKAFNYLTIRYWIVIIIPTLVVEVAMYIINNLFFQVFFAIVLAIATIATIAILVQSRKIENLILIKAKEPIVDEVCWDGIINDETPCYYIINFPLCIDSKTPASVSVKSINCNFMYKKVIMQNMKVQEGAIFATNGMKVDLVTVEGLESNDQICSFNPFPYSELPESNEGWRINGVIEFKWVGGTFKKEFDISVPAIDSMKFEKARLKNQQLYTSVFGTKGVGNE